jgi:hypothetical protein
VAILGSKDSIPFVTFLDANVVVTIVQIQTCEDLSMVQLFNQFILSGQGVAIFDCDGIQATTVHHQAKSPISPFHKLHRRASRRGAGANLACC